jgi:hypothetical protein
MRKLITNAIALSVVSAAILATQAADAQGIFRLPNFVGDTRVQDSHYNTMHQYPHQDWDEYQLLLQSYAAQARAAGSQQWPNPPYNRYNYPGSLMTPGPNGPVPPPWGDTPTIVDGSSGVYVDPNNGNISGLPQAGINTQGGASTSVSGQVLNPASFNTAPGLVGP